MTPAYTAMLGLKVCFTAIKSEKIDSSSLKTFDMVIAIFQVKNKLGRDQFFQEIFWLANINMKMVLEMSFFIFSNANIQFADQELI